MFIEIIVISVIVYGIFLAVKGHKIQYHAFSKLGATLKNREWVQKESEQLLTTEEEVLFLTSLSGIRMKIIGVLLIAIPCSLLMLLNMF
ncbi:hypothetical protein [Niallia sp. 03133]|uniref:hypothetical protein n=1 Tax=Niallia sp. 03133 TaxID=3458060 RepID=UPI0040440EB7